jgi:hypothetical protein
MNIRISYVVKLAGKPAIGVFHVHNEQEAKDIAISYFNNIPIDTNKIIHYTERGLNNFPSYIVPILKNIDSEVIYITDVIVSNKYVSATISEGMKMSIKTNNGIQIKAHSNRTSDGVKDKVITTKSLKIYPIIEADSKDNHKKEK